MKPTIRNLSPRDGEVIARGRTGEIVRIAALGILLEFHGANNKGCKVSIKVDNDPKRRIE